RMFKLQRLEITGFKSFADHTELVFTGDGITAVVGPNGCGKSNVADAIAWVLGEQRVKHLRGAEMKDVIFQGSRNRAPSGMAEVVLHMVRDETVEHEPEIDDIDSTLEEIDEHNIEVEERLAPALLGEAIESQSTQTALPAAQTETTEDGQAVAVEATSETSAPAGPLDGDETQTESNALVESDASVEALSVANDPAASPVEVEIIAPKGPHAKRHWRPSRRALEFAPGEVVSVTRRLYRSGESEYLLNNRACRLRDIQDLFSGTGLSGAHYAIIEQGRIGQILSAKPMDRRTLIEEAAGITKFRVRQRAAETRLESARSNLSRISDIVSEIDRQVNSLRRQAAKARRYRVLREELRELLRGVYVAEEHTLSALLEETRVRVEEVSQEERELIEQLATHEDEARHATQGARVIEEELSEARSAAATAALQRDRRARERTYQEEQAIALDKRRADIEADMLSLRERLASVEEECESLRQKDATLRTESEESARVLQSAEAAYSQKLLEASAAEAAIESARAELLTHTAVAERLMEIGRQLEAAIERLALQAEGLAHEGERARVVHAERITEAEALNQEIATAREHLSKLIAEREAAVHTVVAGHETVSETDSELTRVRDEFSRARHRLDSLLELDTRRAHYSSAVQRIFSDTEASEEFHFMGTLADMLNVEPQWERAVEGVFGSSLQAIIVPTPEDAARAAAWLREHDAGRASFLVAGLHGASDEADTAITYRSAPADTGNDSNGTMESFDNARVGDLLGAPRELQSVLNRTLTQRMNARLSSSLDDAIAKSLATGEMYVTRDGDWVAGGQLVNAGDERALEEGAGLLGFKRELRELETRSSELSVELAAAEQTAAEARARLTELEDAVVLLNEVIGREERDAMTRELTARQLGQEIERAERHLRVIADDAARLAQERLELEERRATAL
ncbi:MAG TPA: AAA family ATPase, partial [Pyrinomonadaceae bacterium]|nr:AAA family ATPase [Pyrinomonadaceae bacterium]